MHCARSSAVSDAADVSALDVERAVDQLVDEVSSRIHDMRCLLGDREDSSSWPDEGIRRGASEIIERLSQPFTRESTATALLKTLWPGTAVEDIPQHWFSTPLGTTLCSSRFVATMSGEARRRTRC